MDDKATGLLEAGIRDFRARQERGLAKLITLVEASPELSNSILSRIGESPAQSQCHVIGFTGPPGAGKSTLVNAVTAVLRGEGHRVGIIAVDPTSPFSGGAMLGDRIRMERHYLDPGVFIRSLATRGGIGGCPGHRGRDQADAGLRFRLHPGGDGRSGPTELDVMAAVDTVAVVLVPEAGIASRPRRRVSWDRRRVCRARWTGPAAGNQIRCGPCWAWPGVVVGASGGDHAGRSGRRQRRSDGGHQPPCPVPAPTGSGHPAYPAGRTELLDMAFAHWASVEGHQGRPNGETGRGVISASRSGSLPQGHRRFGVGITGKVRRGNPRSGRRMYAAQ